MNPKDRDAARDVALGLVPDWHADEPLTSRVDLRERIKDAILEAKAEEAENMADEPWLGSQLAYFIRKRAAELRAQKSTAIREGK